MIELPSKGERFITPFGELVIGDRIGKGKSGYSFLAEHNSMRFVLKVMHDEPNPYYQFEQTKVDAEVAAYQILKNLSVPIPELKFYDSQKKYLIKEYIAGSTAAESIANGEINDEVFRQLFEISRTVSDKQINIDYFPTNFVINENKLFYIDYEINSYDEKWNFENWGIYYWMNSEGFKKFLETGDAQFINSNLTAGIPIKEPFESKVKLLIKKFGE